MHITLEKVKEEPGEDNLKSNKGEVKEESPLKVLDSIPSQINSPTQSIESP